VTGRDTTPPNAWETPPFAGAIRCRFGLKRSANPSELGSVQEVEDSRAVTCVQDACKRFGMGYRFGRTAQHVGDSLTCENSTNRRRRTPVITGQVLLLICGFGVQVPGGAPCLTCAFGTSGSICRGASYAEIG
jgi:hypothetical protein